MSEPRLLPWQDPVLASSFRMMRASLLVGLVSSVACGLVGLVARGGSAGASALLGSLAVVAFFLTGMPVQLLAMGQQLQAGLGIVVACYVSRVAILGLVLVSLTGNGATARPDLLPMSLAIVVTTIAWIGGLLIGHARARVPVFDQPRPNSGNGGR